MSLARPKLTHLHLASVAFSQSIDPGNKAIQELVAFCSTNEVTTGVFTIDDELGFNVFMRTESEVVQGESAEAEWGSEPRRARRERGELGGGGWKNEWDADYLRLSIEQRRPALRILSRR